ncbi:MAG: hypothetical protein ACR2P2_04100 [Nakamurella sp.]
MIAAAPFAAPMLVNTTDNNQYQRDALLAAGFVARRIGELWRIPVAALAGRTVEATFHHLVPLDQCDLAWVVELDNAVRSDIPGAEAWRGNLTDFAAPMDDDEFDPELYLIAEHTTTGAYDGLVRVWNRVPLPRLGCLGVRAPWRRTRIPVALMSAAATVLARRGVTQVITETDVLNRGSHVMAARRGTSVGTMTEWERAPELSHHRARLRRQNTAT